LHRAQQATLETRDAKHEPRSLAEQRVTWFERSGSRARQRELSRSMARTALAPHPETAPMADSHWIANTADHILTVMEASRSTWQMWHVRAEAQRQIRTIDVSAEDATALVDLLVDEVLDRRSVALVPPRDGIEEPDVLRRTDGSSVYTVAGSDLYTSQRILDAEQRLVATADRRDGTLVDESAVDLALLEMAANRTALDAGQASLVQQMCTSGARLQLAIAPAGAGKTTAMRALTLAWTQDGGQVIGLAPSAAAAAVLGEETGIRTDTLAKLTWSLDHGELPDWAAAVGPSTLVIIDEAGMADTLTLDAAVQFAIGHGASVRLVGDDQQLAAIGAGGVLRDITHTHGALHLTELHRFADPDEAAATLALREGKPEALNFYLDHGRVHVGDLATTTHDAFAAWVSDRAAGLDAIMLAPTRKLAAELNRQARDHLLASQPAGRDVRLADGNQASVGDMIITRTNDRRLHLAPTDWVKNGDRWTVTHVGQRGDLAVRHNRSHRTVRLPADYVRISTGLGYATTIHGAQGVSADTMHGLVTGQESRQQLYTMLTRGRAANHLYLQVVGDGDPHTLIRPDTLAPRTPTETLQQILAATTAPYLRHHPCMRKLTDPAVRLHEAVQRYNRRAPCRGRTKLLGPQTWRLGAPTEPSQLVSPGSPNERPWPDAAACTPAQPWRLRPASTPLLHLQIRRQWTENLRTAARHSAVLYRRHPERQRPPGPGRTHALACPVGAIPRRSSMRSPPGVNYLTSSVLDSGRTSPNKFEITPARRRGPSRPWAPPGSHPSNRPHYGEVTIWRAANGIDHQ
jgi:hypothetical protein